MNIKLIIPMMTLAVSSAFAQEKLSSGIDKSNMDLTVRPGTDFYEYAAGGWMKAHPLTPEFSRYSQFEQLSENNEKQMRELILGLSSSPQAPGSLGQKIGTLYNLAMDSTRRNRDGWQPLRPMLERVEAVASKPELIVTISKMAKSGIPSFFAIYCGADIKNSTENLVQIYQGGLSMDERDYYLSDDEATVRVRNAYKEYVKKLFSMTGSTEADADRKMKAVLAIETRIARASCSSTQLRDIEANYNKMSYARLLADYPGIDWSTLLLYMGYPAIDEVSVGQPAAIHEVEKVIAESSLDDLKAYTAFKLIDDAANYLDDTFRATSFDFYGRTMSGAQQDRPRWKRAVGIVNGVMGEAVGRMYVEKYFPESSKQRMLTLVKNLQTALGERILLQKWMSPETKEQALDKLNSFRVKIGYPDKWRDYSGLVIDDCLSYFENMVRASEFFIADGIAQKVGKPVDRDEWHMTPQTINAYYNPTTNEICFPAGILQPPFFNPEADDACNYGAIGVVIGHEMTHGFDDQGSQFDKQGNLRNWWTVADAENFKKRTKVMIDFFNKVETLPGMRANGELTVGENIADHGGLKIAYQALQNAMKEQPLADKDGFTPEQRFYLSYATIWAQNTREELLRQYNKTDPHSPARQRVNCALPHIDTWYKAFGITRRDPLFVPKKERVDVW